MRNRRRLFVPAIVFTFAALLFSVRAYNAGAPLVYLISVVATAFAAGLLFGRALPVERLSD